MSAFPPKQWEIRFLQDMETLVCEPTSENGIYMESYVAVRPAGGAEGNFRFALAGTEKLKLSFPISKVLPGPEFDDMRAELELWPGQQIKLEKNSVATVWWDLEDLINSQDIAIVDGKGVDKSEEFLAAVGHGKKKFKADICRLYNTPPRPIRSAKHLGDVPCGTSAISSWQAERYARRSTAGWTTHSEKIVNCIVFC